MNNLRKNQPTADVLMVSMHWGTEYVLEPNFKGKMTPKAIGLKEDMQGDVRYEFDCVLSLDKDTHEVSIVKDRIGYDELRQTSENPASPLTIEDGRILAKLATEGMSLEEIAKRKRDTYIRFILDEKAHKSSKIQMFETSKKTELTESYLQTLSYELLKKLVDYLK